MSVLDISVSERDRKELFHKKMKGLIPYVGLIWACLIVSLFICVPIPSLEEVEANIGAFGANIINFDKAFITAAIFIMCLSVLFWFLLRFRIMRDLRTRLPDRTELVISNEEIRVGQSSAQRPEICEILRLGDWLFVITIERKKYVEQLILPYFPSVRQEVSLMLREQGYPLIQEIRSYRKVPAGKRKMDPF